MAEAAPPASGRIFISYRREESAYAAGWLYDRLTERFGEGRVFKDVDSIQLGDDFVDVITEAVGATDVLLALIGDAWLTISDEHGRRRLDDPDDFVRLEIEAALARQILVIPIVVDGARMPRAEELPLSLDSLGRRQSLELSPSRFEFDTSRLLKVLDRKLAEIRVAPHGAAPASASAGAGSEPGVTITEEGVPQSRPNDAPTGSATTPPPIGPHDARDEGRPPKTQRWVASPRVAMVTLTTVAALTLLIVLLVIQLTTSEGNGPDGAQEDPSVDERGGIDVDSTPATSPDGITVSGLDVVARNDPPLVDDVLTVRFTLTNSGDQPVKLAYSFVAARTPDNDRADAEDDNEGVTLEPGASVAAEGRILLDAVGSWSVWPCYELDDGRLCPDRWQVVLFSVG